MKKFLIVDDSPVVRKVMRRILETLRFEIEESQDGNSAINSCKMALPNAIILDRVLPDVPGLEVLRKIRAIPGSHDIKIIFCTSENNPTQLNEAKALGVDAIVFKPFMHEELTNTVKSLWFA